jgi:hypothetical protein
MVLLMGIGKGIMRPAALGTKEVVALTAGSTSAEATDLISNEARDRKGPRDKYMRLDFNAGSKKRRVVSPFNNYIVVHWAD